MKIVNLSEAKRMSFPSSRETSVLTGEGLLPTQNFTAGYVVVQPGGKVPLHSHSNEEVYIIMHGTARMTIKYEEATMEAVSAVYIPSNADHTLLNVGGDELIFMFIYSPAGVVDHWSEEMSGDL